MSSLTDVLTGKGGVLSPCDMWPRHSPNRYTGRRYTGRKYHKVFEHEPMFMALYDALCERPLNIGEWNMIMGRSRRSGQAYALREFEEWVKVMHPGHMPYLTCRRDMGTSEWSCWRRKNPKERTCKNTVFICLLGILYKP